MERIKEFLVKPGISIKEALKLMDGEKRKLLFVVNSQGVLLGTVSERDLRKWILKARGLGENITVVMNRNPLFLKEGYLKEEAKNLILSVGVECIPVVDNKKRIISAICWQDIFEGKQRRQKKNNIPVVIMAGGEGVRLYPFTKILPKPLVPVGEKPMIELIIDKFSSYGCRDFYLSVNYKSNIIKAYFSDFEHAYKIYYIQEDEPLGTAGGLRLLKDRITSTFFSVNCDTLIEADYSDILEFHRSNKNKITLVSSLKHYTIPYGICEIKNGGDLKRMREKPEYDFLIITGLYVLEPEVLKLIPKNKPYNMTDLINNCLSRKKKVAVYPVSERSYLDAGQWEELQELLRRFSVKVIEESTPAKP